jgi:nitronate monooxygenase
MTLTADLGLSIPVFAAPMAGGPGTPALVVAAARAGSLGSVAAGYKTAERLLADIATVRAETQIFGVNVFAPNPLPVDPLEFRQYAATIQAEAHRYGLDLAAVQPRDDDDGWQDKVDLLLAEPVPVISFTFGVPDSAVIRAFQRGGSFVVQTVTSPAEAELADARGVDALVVQSPAAGGHYGTFSPRNQPFAGTIEQLVAAVQLVCRLPIVAAGGLTTSESVARVLRAGADAAMVGTALLRSDESGATAHHRDALVDPARHTVVTRAFTGRPARALSNDFIARYEARAPFGYPALHYLTGLLRRAANEAGDPELVNLWAGTGHRVAEIGPAEVLLQRLATDA